MSRVALVLLLALLVPLTPFPAAAHSLQSLYLEIREIAPGRAQLIWGTGAADSELRLLSEAGCQLTGEDPAASLGGAAELLLCDGRRIEVEGLGVRKLDLIVRLVRRDGSGQTRVLTMGEPTWRLPARPSALAGGWQYLRLGVAHIFSGLDHLLFIAILWLAATSRRRLLWTLTAFTLAHSLTLALTVLGWLRVAPAFAESGIALTLLLAALAVPSSAASRPPASGAGEGPGLAFAFGLVHGLGFAGALREIGFPEEGIGWSLGAFNVGVELGQVVFVVLLSLLARAARSLPGSSPAGLRLSRGTAIYAIGALGVFWLLRRLLPVL